MDSNTAFQQRLQAGQAQFFLADLHVHSPASPCFGNGEASPLAKEIAEHEQRVLDSYPVGTFYDELVRHRNATIQDEHLPAREDWAVIAITDHNVCTYACRLSQHAWEADRLRANRLILLPGMELSVDFRVAGTQQCASAHLLLIFHPLAEPQQVYAAIRETSGVAWEFGDTLAVDDLPTFVSGIRRHHDHPAICIAAHVGSSKGVREEAKNCVLSHLDAEISRLEGELSASGTPDRQKLESQLASFKSRRSDSAQVSLEVLHLIGLCGFDALQTRGPRDETYYRRLHRFRAEQGRSVSVVCSDAHTVGDVFYYTDPADGTKLIPFAKLSGLTSSVSPESLFTEIRDKALCFGETRTTCLSPGSVTTWIEGIEIAIDAKDSTGFWPFSNDGDVSPQGVRAGRFTIGLSRNLNCVIGGRGSGKSALIEAIAFACNPAPFNDKLSQKEDWYGRAQATLRGCRVRICCRLLGDAHHDLPKKALYLSRYFDASGKHPSVVAANHDDKEILPGSLPPLYVQVFRIHDIETAARPEKLRSLFDGICGVEITELSAQITQAIAALAKQRATMLAVARKIAVLTKDNSPLRQYARRKQAYDAVNRAEIRDQYQVIDEAQAAEDIGNTVKGKWQEVYEGLGIEVNKESVAAFFVDATKPMVLNETPLSAGDQLEEATTTDQETGDSKEDGEVILEKSYKPYCEPLARAIEGVSSTGVSTTTARDRVVAALDLLDTECQGMTTALQTSIEGVQEIHRSARDTLASRGHPTGSAERQAKKTAFEAAEKDLVNYQEQWQQWDVLLKQRLDSFQTLKDLCVRRTNIRKQTADSVSKRLAAELDPTILQIEADAQPVADLRAYTAWLNANVRWHKAQHKEKRFEELAKKLTPEALRNEFISRRPPNLQAFLVDKPTAADGRITIDDAKAIVAGTAGVQHLDAEMSGDEASDLLSSLPTEIQEGLWTFAAREGGDELLIDAVLGLDEVVLDDLPVIRLNDRPAETQVMKPLEKLSPGQRCSAILPILLLNGNCPLIIDQPEDNLDNRLIRQVIVNVLASIKLRRQVIVATHNPNLPVLGDAEQVIVLRAVEEEQCVLETQGVLDDSSVVRSITEVMEGGREAFQYRQQIYQKHWTGGADPK